MGEGVASDRSSMGPWPVLSQDTGHGPMLLPVPCCAEGKKLLVPAESRLFRYSRGLHGNGWRLRLLSPSLHQFGLKLVLSDQAWQQVGNALQARTLFGGGKLRGV